MKNHADFENHLPNKIRTIHHQALQASAKYKSAEIDLINILDQVDQHKVYLRYGYSSLFQYGVQCLGLSESTTYSLIAVTRKSREVPELKEEIKNGQLTLSKAKRITSVINQENKEQWLELAKTSTQAKVEREVAKVNPQEARRGRMTFVHPQNEIQEKVAIKQEPNAVRVQLQVGISEKLMIKMRRVQDLVSQKSQRPATLEETLAAMLELFLEKQDPLEKAKRQLIRGRLSEKKQGGEKNSLVGNESGGRNLCEKGDLGEANIHLSQRTNAPDSHLVSRKAPGAQLVSRNAPGAQLVSRKAAEMDASKVDSPDKDQYSAMTDKGRDTGRKCATGTGTGTGTEQNRAQSSKKPNIKSHRRQPLPAKTKHRLMLKFSGRCSHVNHRGERCRETKFLEIHHLKPVSLGGENHLENLTLLCSGHHQGQHLNPMT
ncbi:MAG: HNH endonuclease [Bdellovibrionales bacterium]|nr:HNH endonuclease [Bdellovibrionales bacterium]